MIEPIKLEPPANSPDLSLRDLWAILKCEVPGIAAESPGPSPKDLWQILRFGAPDMDASSSISVDLVCRVLADRGIRHFIDKDVPFTAGMVARELPLWLTPPRHTLGLSFLRFQRYGQIQVVNTVFRDYPERTGKPAYLWMATS